MVRLKDIFFNIITTILAISIPYGAIKSGDLLSKEHLIE